MLEPLVKPLNDILFEGTQTPWIFQQDSAPAYKSKHCQGWPANNVLADNWTSGILDLNPLYYELWDILEQNACRKTPSKFGVA